MVRQRRHSFSERVLYLVACPSEYSHAHQLCLFSHPRTCRLCPPCRPCPLLVFDAHHVRQAQVFGTRAANSQCSRVAIPRRVLSHLGFDWPVIRMSADQTIASPLNVCIKPDISRLVKHPVAASVTYHL